MDTIVILVTLLVGYLAVGAIMYFGGYENGYLDGMIERDEHHDGRL